MIEMPEAHTIATQMENELTGKVISGFNQGSMTHKFLWLNRPIEEMELVLPGAVVTGASSYGRSIYLHLGDRMLWWGDAGGRLLYHTPEGKLPKKYHLAWNFTDGTMLTFNMQMWGFVRLLEQHEFTDLPNEETGLPPLHTRFTLERFEQMLESYPDQSSKGIKGFLVATGYAIPDPINGLGNAIVQDILFQAGLSPKRKIAQIRTEERSKLYRAIQDTIAEAIKLGGRYDERDLYGKPGRYIRLMDSKTAGTPCTRCGTDIKKISYLGGACYICPICQT
jgi:formamidopyrimidine-DNA glycosylase